MILPKGKSSKSGISLDGVIFIFQVLLTKTCMDVGCPPKTASPTISFHQPFPDTKLKTKRQGAVIGFGGFFNAGHGNFNTSWRFSAWKPEPWKRWLRQRPTNLWWIKGVLSWVKTSKKRIEGGSPQLTHGPGEKCVVYSYKDMFVLLVFC